MKRLIIIGAVALVLGAVGFRLSRDLERYTYTADKGYSRRAREDDYLALRRWAGMNGIALEGNRTGDIGEYDSILVNGTALDDRPFAEALPEWVAEGGHLTVFLAPSDISDPDFETVESLAAVFGFELTVEPAQEAFWVMEAEGTLRGKGAENRVVRVSPDIRLIAGKLPKGSTFVAADDGNGYYLASLPAGEGRLTLTGDPLFLKNGYIGESDNASLAWDLVGTPGGTGRILFLPESAAGKGFVGEPWAAAVLAAIASALALAAWRALARRDAPLDAETPTGSDIGRRLAAEGNFFRAHGCTGTYLTACRTDAMRRLRRRGFVDGDGLVDAEALSRKLRTDTALLQWAFAGDFESGDGRTGKKEFREMMRIYHDIKEEI